MLQPNIVSSAATFAMLGACVLAIGFMVRFFVAMVGETKTGVRNPLGAKRVHFVGYQPQANRGPVVDPGAHIALGVLRIATVLAGSPKLETAQSLPNWAHSLKFSVPGPEPNSASQRLYRLS